MKSWLYLRVGVLFLCVVATGFGQGEVPVEFSASDTNGQVAASLLWGAEPGDYYEILTTTNLADGAWTQATIDPVPATNLVAQIEILSTNPAAYFRVRHLDTHGPQIVSRYPDNGAVGVSTQAVLVAELSDPSGIDTNSIAFTVDGSSTFTLADAGLSFTNNTVLFEPIKSWGSFAETSTVVLACTDTQGNPFLSEWSFTLERDPLVSSNAFLISGGAQPMAMGMAAAASSSLSLIETAPDYLRFSYSGSHGLSVGAILVSDDADNIFYRRVLSLDESGAGEVKAYTEDVPLTALIEEGSFETSDFSMIEDGALAMAFSLGTGSKTFVLPFEYSNTFSRPIIHFDSADLNVVTSIDFDGTVILNGEIKDWEMQGFNAEIAGSLDVDIDASLEVLVPLAQINGELELGHKTVARAAGHIAGWPVWIDVVVTVYICAEGSADAVFTFEQSSGFSASNSYNLKWTAEEGWSVPDPDPEFSFDPPTEPTLTAGVNGSASVYLRPEIAARVYSAAGVYVDYRRGLKVDASWRVGDSQCVFELFDTASVNIGADVIGVGNGYLPQKNLWQEDKPMDIVWYWPENPLAAPVILTDPSDWPAKQGKTVTFYASASGNPAPTYKWYRDGQLVAYGSSLSVTASSYTTGDYKYKATNNRGSAWSAVATLSLSGGGTVPTGMVRIPGGTNSGTDPDYGAYSLTVDSFYMDKTEVTKAQWDTVYNWAVSHGYSFGNVGSGKASNHPVQTVNWYDCVKWCNARSQMEGKTPCYTVGGSTYKSGESTPTCNFSASGYRLPTSDEWEYAARGGLSGRRFPWGDTISHARAHYDADYNVAYDESYPAGKHPDYVTGAYPYTSPAGSFSSNGYGLYDMSGNVFEWCNTPSGSRRGIRGGSWINSANLARCGYASWYDPGREPYFIGFRSVCR